MSKMKLITLHLPESYIRNLDQFVEERFYPNRAEAIRTAIRDLIKSEVWKIPRDEPELKPETEPESNQ